MAGISDFRAALRPGTPVRHPVRRNLAKAEALAEADPPLGVYTRYTRYRPHKHWVILTFGPVTYPQTLVETAVFRPRSSKSLAI